MIPNEKDNERRQMAEAALKHMNDQARQIEAAAVEASRILAPIRKRGKQNHYLEEAMNLLDRRRGK